MVLEKRSCIVCNDGFHYDKPVYCFLCGAPYHEDCWVSQGNHCVVEDCDSTKIIETALVSDGVGLAEDISADTISSLWRRPQHQLNTPDKTSKLSGRRGRKSTPDPFGLQAAERHQNRTPIQGTKSKSLHKGVGSAVKYLRIDPDTFMEKAFSWLSIGFLAAGALWGIRRNGVYDFQILQIVCPAALFFSILRLFTDATYVVDNVNDIILYSRTIFGFTQNYKVCRFHEVDNVGMSAKVGYTSGRNYNRRRHHYVYATILKLENGACFRVSADMLCFGKVRALSSKVADVIGCEFKVGGKEVGSFEVNSMKVPMADIDTEWRKWYQLINPGPLEVVMLIVSSLAVFFVFSQ